MFPYLGAIPVDASLWMLIPRIWFGPTPFSTARFESACPVWYPGKEWSPFLDARAAFHCVRPLGHTAVPFCRHSGRPPWAIWRHRTTPNDTELQESPAGHTGWLWCGRKAIVATDAAASDGFAYEPCVRGPGRCPKGKDRAGTGPSRPKDRSCFPWSQPEKGIRCLTFQMSSRQARKEVEGGLGSLTSPPCSSGRLVYMGSPETVLCLAALDGSVPVAPDDPVESYLARELFQPGNEGQEAKEQE